MALLRFPSEASSCFVCFTPSVWSGFTIGCVIPPKRRRVKLKFYSETDIIKVPQTLWLAAGGHSTYRIFAIHRNKERDFSFSPLRLGNVGKIGNVCWPDLYYPIDLRSAHRIFWSSAFSNEDDYGISISPFGEDYLVYLKNYYSNRRKINGTIPSLEQVIGVDISETSIMPKGANAFDTLARAWVNTEAKMAERQTRGSQEPVSGNGCVGSSPTLGNGESK